MSTIRTSTYDDDPRYTLYEVDGKRYVGGPDLMVTSGFGGTEWSHYTVRYCKCCNQPKSEPFGPVARSWEEVVELGWVMTEEAFKEWRRK